MPIKSKIITLVLCILNLFIFNLYVSADEFNISAEEIIIDKVNNIVIGSGSVEATDIQGRVIKANKIIYKNESIVPLFNTHSIDFEQADLIIKLQDVVNTNGQCLLKFLGYETNEKCIEFTKFWLNLHTTDLKQRLIKKEII